MGLTAQAAGIYLLAVVPIGLFVAYSDLSRMKIPNLATDGLLLAYAILGFFVLPFSDYLWGYSHFAVMLLIGITLNAAGQMGAGDSKFIASAGPFVALSDLRLVLVLLAACFLAGYATHRIARHTPIRNLVPHWESWEQGKRFPMGFPLACTLIFYLLLVFLAR